MFQLLEEKLYLLNSAKIFSSLINRSNIKIDRILVCLKKILKEFNKNNFTFKCSKSSYLNTHIIQTVAGSQRTRQICSDVRYSEDLVT